MRTGLKTTLKSRKLLSVKEENYYRSTGVNRSAINYSIINPTKHVGLVQSGPHHLI